MGHTYKALMREHSTPVTLGATRTTLPVSSRCVRRSDSASDSAMSLLRGCVLLAAGLLVLVSALPAPLRGGRSPASSTEYGVKLCGREFIRAVIFTCGGSRWKRLSADNEEQGNFLRRDGLQDSTNREVKVPKLKALFGANMEKLTKPDFPLQQLIVKDPFTSYDDFSDYMPESEAFTEYIRQMQDTDGNLHQEPQNSAALGSDGFPWTTLSRRRREMSIGIAGICCKWGCTKAEISTLC
ncbi:relaxin-3-like [Hyperolius riggenbachi]|uniref:relaxin-3-like n=1 Tax=Hyperolius riggenbachi TaxID=752182 RepID=UPI0035A26805